MVDSHSAAERNGHTYEFSRCSHQLPRSFRGLAIHRFRQAFRRRQRRLLVRRAACRRHAGRSLVLHAQGAQIRLDERQCDRHDPVGDPRLRHWRPHLLRRFLSGSLPQCGRHAQLHGNAPHLGRRSCHLRHSHCRLFDRLYLLPHPQARSLGHDRLLRDGSSDRAGDRSLGQLYEP